MMKSKKAFTLVELLVVISIIALLLSILMPSLSAARERGKRISCGNNIRQILIGAYVYSTANDNKLPVSKYVKDNLRPFPPNLYYSPPAWCDFDIRHLLCGSLREEVKILDCGTRYTQHKPDWDFIDDCIKNGDANKLTNYWGSYVYFVGRKMHPDFGDSKKEIPEIMTKGNGSMVLIQDECRIRDERSPYDHFISNHGRNARDRQSMKGANLGFYDGHSAWHSMSQLVDVGWDWTYRDTAGKVQSVLPSW